MIKDSKHNKLFFIAAMILIISIILNFLLNIASFENIYRFSLISKYKLLNKSISNKIQTDLNYGKPIYMLSNLEDYFYEISERNLSQINIFVASLSGEILYSSEKSYISKILIDEMIPSNNAFSNESILVKNLYQNYYIYSALLKSDNEAEAYVCIEFDEKVINNRVNKMVRENIIVLSLILIFSIIILFIALYFKNKFSFNKRIDLFIIGIILVLSQIFYSFINTKQFEKNYLFTMEEKINYFSNNIDEEIQFFLHLGLSLDKLTNFDNYLHNELLAVPECEQIYISKNNNIYYYADSNHDQGVDINSLGFDADYSNDPYTMSHIIEFMNHPVAVIITRINKAIINKQIQDLFLDAITILIVSLIISYQLLLFPGLKKQSTEMNNNGSQIYNIDNDILIRLLSFLFYFAEMLPLSFLPLLIAKLYHASAVQSMNISETIILSLPIACYLLGTAIAVIVVGNFLQGISKKKIFLYCSIMLVIGAIGASQSTTIWMLTFFRLISGVGYGGISINSTSLILEKYKKDKLALGFGFWASGYGAASICALAISGVIVFRFGFSIAMLFSSIVALVLVLFILFYLRTETTKHDKLHTKKIQLGKILNIFTDRLIAANFFLRLVPFHLMYVGVLQFIFPLLMDEHGISQANIGRILSLFGLIYITMPFVSKLVNKWRKEKYFIFFGSLIIGCSMLLIEFGTNLFIFIIIVTGISLGSMIADAAEEAFIASTKKASQIGKTRLMTMYNSYERFLMVISPLICSLLINTFNLKGSIIFIGVYTIVSTIFYLFFTRKSYKGHQF